MHVLLKDDSVKKKAKMTMNNWKKDQTVSPDNRQTVKISNGQINNHRQTVQLSTEKTRHRQTDMENLLEREKTIEKITDTMNNYFRLNG